MNLTWKDVLNSDAPFSPVRHGGHIDAYLVLVDMVGYRYFSWNGKIYELMTGKRELGYRDTGLTEEDLG